MSNPLLGNRISLISKRDIRYEGTLYSINETDATVALQNVKTYGTEGREERTDPPGTFVPPMPDVHSCLVFRGCDIKDLHVHDESAGKESKEKSSLPDDPAIVSTEAPPRAEEDSNGGKQREQSAKGDGKGKSGGTDRGGNDGKTRPEKTEPQDASAAPSTNGVDSDSGSGRRGKQRQPGGERGPRDAAKVNGGGTKQQQQQQRGSAADGGGSSSSLSNGQKSTNNRNNNRRTRKSDMQVGTGASLLRRKERGAVGGAEDPTTGEFDFESSTAGFEKEHVGDEADEAVGTGGGSANGAAGAGDTEVYTKDDFFDSISCDAIDRRDGVDNRLRGASERSLNVETFGAASLGNGRRGGRRYRRGGGGGGRSRGGRGGRGGGGGGGGDQDRSGGGAPRQNRRWRRGPNYSSREQSGGFNSAPRTARAGGES